MSWSARGRAWDVGVITAEERLFKRPVTGHTVSLRVVICGVTAPCKVATRSMDASERSVTGSSRLVVC